MSCLLPSFSFHTHILFCSPLPCPCRAVSPTPIARERLSPCVAVCVCACVCLRVFPPDFCCLFLLTSPPSHRRRRFTRSLVGYKFLKFFSSFFSRTHFSSGKNEFFQTSGWQALAGSACILLLACLQLGMRVPLEFEKSNENKTRTHSLSSSSSSTHSILISLMWIQFVDDIVKVVCVSLSERGMLFGVSQEKLDSSTRCNSNNNNYKALSVQ